MPFKIFPRANLSSSSVGYSFYLSLFLILFCNLAFFSAVNQFTGLHKFTDLLFLVSSGILFGSVTFIFLLLMTFPYWVRLITWIILIGSAAAVYFIINYGILIHEIMIQNMLETDLHEIKGLLNLKIAFYLIVLGIVPGIIFFRIKIIYRSLWQEIKLRIIGLASTIGIIILSIVPFTAEYYSFFHDHKEIRQQSIPLSFIYASISYTFGDSSFNQTGSVRTLGEDAVLKENSSTRQKPLLFILVLGEAARADHFSTNGYARPTTTHIMQENIFNFSSVWSCGTETAVSVPCMFSGLGKENYSERKAKSQEGLLDIVQRAGYKVLWRDNNSGCKETCNRVGFENLAYLDIPEICAHGECYDDILLWELEKRLQQPAANQLIVLHQKGSHGPDYFNRVPESARLFQPVCQKNLLQDCTLEGLTNAYDNTIAYTDKILTQTIGFLKNKSNQYQTVFLYLSDHGESLGEKKIYLHGLPYSLAPDAQKHIPFIVWFSEDYSKNQSLNSECISGLLKNSYSQDNLFHTMLGLLNVETKVYDSSLDIFNQCRITQQALNQ